MSKPFVSCVCPTYNRRQFLPNLLKIYKSQTYPHKFMELVILDDSEKSNQDIIEEFQKKNPDLNIRYIYQTERLALGKKRNLVNSLAKGEYIVCFDDDDYYSPDRVSHAILKMKQTKLDLAGSSILHIYYTDTQEIYEFGPYGQFHATNGTLAYHKSYSDKNKYNDEAKMQEEPVFLNNYQSPMVQLSPYKVMLCIAHKSNTFDKSNIRKNGKKTSLKLKNFVEDKELLEFYKNLTIKPVTLEKKE